jgi:hypothetical protein
MANGERDTNKHKHNYSEEDEDETIHGSPQRADGV